MEKHISGYGKIVHGHVCASQLVSQRKTTSTISKLNLHVPYRCAGPEAVSGAQRRSAGLRGGQRGSEGVSGGQRGSVGARGGQWGQRGSVGATGGQWGQRRSAGVRGASGGQRRSAGPARPAGSAGACSELGYVTARCGGQRCPPCSGKGAILCWRGHCTRAAVGPGPGHWEAGPGRQEGGQAALVLRLRGAEVQRRHAEAGAQPHSPCQPSPRWGAARTAGQGGQGALP